MIINGVAIYGSCILSLDIIISSTCKSALPLLTISNVKFLNVYNSLRPISILNSIIIFPIYILKLVIICE